ncbi:MAG: anti-sigma factor [Acidobacteriota bacterium]
MTHDPTTPSNDPPAADDHDLATLDAEAAASAALDLLDGALDLEALHADAMDPETAAHVAACCALAHELEPVAPAPHARERLLAAAIASRRTEPTSVAPFRAANTGAKQPSNRRFGALELALAAGLAALCFGLGVFVAPQLAPQPNAPSVVASVDEATSANEATSADETAAADRSDSAEEAVSANEADVGATERIAELEADLDVTRRRLKMVTTIARQAYPMQAQPARATAASADGIVYVCGAHQRWYLALSAMPPADAHHEYRVWFLTDDGTVEGGTIEVDQSGTAGLDATSMPRGTRGFAVTLEPIEPGVSRAAFDDRIVLRSRPPVRL